MDNLVINKVTWDEGEADGNADEENLMLFKCKDQARDKDPHQEDNLQYKLGIPVKLQSVGINAGDAGVGVIGRRNAPPLTMQCNSMETEEGMCVDGVEDEVAGVVEEVTAHRLM